MVSALGPVARCRRLRLRSPHRASGSIDIVPKPVVQVWELLSLQKDCN